MNEIVTESQVRRRYMELDRKFHPDKNDPTTSGRNRPTIHPYRDLHTILSVANFFRDLPVAGPLPLMLLFVRYRSVG